MWDTLVAQEDVHVGVLSTVASKPKVDRVDEEQKEETPATMAVDGATGEEGEQPVEGSPAPSASSTADKGKGKAKEDDKKGKKKKGKGSGEEQVATHEFRVLKGEEKEESRESLLERYGEDLRIAVGAQTAWIAITGSSMRVSPVVATDEGRELTRDADLRSPVLSPRPSTRCYNSFRVVEEMVLLLSRLVNNAGSTRGVVSISSKSPSVSGSCAFALSVPSHLSFIDTHSLDITTAKSSAPSTSAPGRTEFSTFVTSAYHLTGQSSPLPTPSL